MNVSLARPGLKIHPQQQGFDVAKAQCEPMLEPDGMADDFRREAVDDDSLVELASRHLG